MNSYYYLDAAGQPAGPLSLQAIDEQIAAGRLSATVMIVEVGGATWIPRSALGTPSGDANAPPPAAPASKAQGEAFDARQAADRLVSLSPVLGNLVAGALGLATRVLTVSMLNGLLRSSKVLGHLMVLIGAVLTLVYGLVTAIKQEAFSLVLIAVVLVFALAVAQFVAQRFLDAADVVIDNTPSRVSSSAFFECVAMMWVLLAVAMIVGGVVAMSATPLAFVPALVISLILLAMATVLLHPECVNTEARGAGSAGEEVIGIVSTFLKGGLKITPIIFFLFAAVGVIAIAASFFGGRSAQQMLAGLPMGMTMMSLGGAGFGGAGILVMACILPMLFYFLFLLLYVNLDVLRAILAVPGKLDVLAESKNG